MPLSVQEVRQLTPFWSSVASRPCATCEREIRWKAHFRRRIITGNWLFKTGIATLVGAGLFMRLSTGNWAPPSDMVMIIAAGLILAGIFWTRTKDPSGQLEAGDDVGQP